jgi:hypothetical protein
VKVCASAPEQTDGIVPTRSQGRFFLKHFGRDKSLRIGDPEAEGVDFLQEWRIPFGKQPRIIDFERIVFGQHG